VLVARIICFSIAVLASAPVFCQTYPHKPVRIVCSPPGSSNDFFARVIAQELTGSLGQQVIVDNRVGTVAVDIVAKAVPDGHTLLSYGTPLWILPLLRDNVPWDLIRDFSPISWTTSSPNILTVNPAVPAKSVQELIALARAKPGELNYATGSTGSSTHISGELFKSMAGVNIVAVPYKGSGPSLIALLGREVQLMFPSTTSAAPHVREGRVRALAITSAQPSALFPDLPTVASAGVPGYVSVALIAFFTAARTPAPIIARLNQEIVRALAQNDVREKFLKVGVEPATGTPEQLAAAMKTDMTVLGKVIKDVGIRAD
jgi:tripartite-type tricarboxylate transporter receptor subunit TctC